MFVSKVLFCVSVLSSSQIIFALTGRRCFDCVSIASCESGLDFARKLRSGALPPESRQTFFGAICGSDEHNDKIPKVCCSDFPMSVPTFISKSPTPSIQTENRNLLPSNPIPSNPTPSNPTPSNPTPSNPTTSNPTPSNPIPSNPIPSNPIPSKPIPSNPIPSDPIENHQNIGLLPSSCGDIDGSRIINGEVAKIYEFPWMTLISYNKNGLFEFNCAGSVINSRYILTAAHCVIENGVIKDIAGVRVGDFDYKSKIDCQGDYENMICESKIQDLEVEDIIPHPLFTGVQPVKYDIALLRVKKAITMTNNAAPVCLPVYSDLRNLELAGKNGTVAGWGMTEKQTFSSTLMKVSIPILTGDACNHYYSRYDSEQTSTMETSFCAGAKMKDSCRGDSGGPLMVESEYGNSISLIQFGIVSYGPRQCGSAYPGVYTDVRNFVKWILDNMRE